MSTNNDDQELRAKVKAVNDLLTEHGLSSNELSLEDGSIAEEARELEKLEETQGEAETDSASLFSNHSTPKSHKGVTFATSKRWLNVWLDRVGRRRCHATNAPFLDESPGYIEYAHVHLPQAVLKWGKDETKNILNRYEYVLGMDPNTLSIHSRLFIMPLIAILHRHLDGFLLFFLPPKCILDLALEFLAMVDAERSKDEEPREPAPQDLWTQMREGKLFDGVFKAGNIYPYHLLASPLLGQSDSLPLFALDLVGDEYRIYRTPVSGFPLTYSHVSPFAIVINAMRVLEYAVKRQKQQEQEPLKNQPDKENREQAKARRRKGVERELNKEKMRKQILKSPTWLDVKDDVKKLLVEQQAPYEEAHINAFFAVADKIAQQELGYKHVVAAKTRPMKPRSDPSLKSYSFRSGYDDTPSKPPSGRSGGSHHSRSGGRDTVTSKTKTNQPASDSMKRPSSPSPSQDTPAALVAQEWKRQQAFSHRFAKALSTGARDSVRAMKKIVKALTVENGIRPRGVLGAIHNVS